MLVLGGLLTLAACAAPAPRPADALRLQLPAAHRAEFAGFYAAERQGLYAAEKLAVTLAAGGPQMDVAAAVTSGASQFGLLSADELAAARAAGQPVRAVAAIYQRSPVAFVSRAEADIVWPRQFAGQTIRTGPGLSLSLRAMLGHNNLRPEQYTEINQPAEPAAFAGDLAPIWGTTVDGLALNLEAAGQRLNYVYPEDYGVHFYGDVLFTSDSLIATQPELVLRFVRASLAGWNHLVEHPDEVGALVASFIPTADPAVENKRLELLLPLIHAEAHGVGWMTAENWAGILQTLNQPGLLAAPIAPDQVYTLQFLRALEVK